MSDDTKQTEAGPVRFGVESLSPEAAAAFEDLLEYLKQTRGFDFTGYKRSSLVRRVSSRMEAVGVDGFGDYVDFLQVDPDEFAHLFDAILINVTGFFRDPPAWQYVAEEVLPRILADKGPTDPIRLWSAGCASGEEAYTLAMVVAERLGPDEMRDRVKIYGTDVDEAALTAARHATYGGREVAGIPEELRNRYFEPVGSEYAFRKDLRRTVIFGRHDLVSAAPISHIDLLACRNTLMYFNAETQAKVLARLHFALEDGGILFLGNAEMLLSHGHLFAPLDLKRRFFVKVSKETLRDRLSVIAEGGSYDVLDYPTNYRRIRELSVDALPSAVVVVHSGGTVALVNAVARNLFGLSVGDIGRPFQDLELSYRPVDLRSGLEQVQNSGQLLVLEQVHWPGGPADTDCFDVHLGPLFDHTGALLGVAITFMDVSLSQRLHDELRHSNRELETAYEELQSTNEELETTNEELQSTIEELETTNEELQSTNEELETMNAELHSTNEELQTINDELRMRTTELDELNDFLEAILVSQRGGMAVIDRDLRVTVWNHRSADLWGVRPDEAPGQHFLNLDIGLPVEDLRPAIKAVLTGDSDHEQVELTATNRRGRDFLCRVSLAPLVSKEKAVRGVILLMEDASA